MRIFTVTVGTPKSLLRWSAFCLTAGILCFGGLLISGCSPDVGDDSVSDASSGSFGELFKPVDEELPAIQAQEQSHTAAVGKDTLHIYLAFGQSNMEGQNWSGTSIAYGSDVLPKAYKENVNPRFRVMTAVAGSYKLSGGNENRVQGQWYKAVPPLIRNTLGLSPADYFGRVLVDSIKDTNIKIGVIAVAVAGAKIEGFEKGSSADAYFNGLAGNEAFMKDISAFYGNNPYNRLVTLAKEAQKVGVVKGIIMHQGESGAAIGANWAQKVKGIYDNILIDLGLPPNSIPFLAGQAYGSSNQNNNGTINGLTKTMTATLPNGDKVAHVISSSGCASGGDDLHFSYEGYKLLGERYGQKMLELNYKNQDTPDPPPTTSIKPVGTRP